MFQNINKKCVFWFKKIKEVVINRKGYSLKLGLNLLGWFGFIIGIVLFLVLYFVKGRFGFGFKICFYEIF